MIKLCGIYEWLIVRISGIIIFFYLTYLLIFICITDKLTYELWYLLFSKNAMKCFSTLTLFAMLIHSWIGIQHILIDYIKLLILQKLFKFIVIAILIIYLLCGIDIIWNII